MTILCVYTLGPTEQTTRSYASITTLIKTDSHWTLILRPKMSEFNHSQLMFLLEHSVLPSLDLSHQMILQMEKITLWSNRRLISFSLMDSWTPRLVSLRNMIVMARSSSHSMLAQVSWKHNHHLTMVTPQLAQPSSVLTQLPISLLQLELSSSLPLLDYIFSKYWSN